MGKNWKYGTFTKKILFTILILALLLFFASNILAEVGKWNIWPAGKNKFEYDLSALNQQQKDLAIAALNQWDNFRNEIPIAGEPGVMDHNLTNGEKDRELSKEDIKTMKEIYGELPLPDNPQTSPPEITTAGPFDVVVELGSLSSTGRTRVVEKDTNEKAKKVKIIIDSSTNWYYTPKDKTKNSDDGLDNDINNFKVKNVF